MEVHLLWRFQRPHFKHLVFHNILPSPKALDPVSVLQCSLPPNAYCSTSSVRLYSPPFALCLRPSFVLTVMCPWNVLRNISWLTFFLSSRSLGHALDLPWPIVTLLRHHDRYVLTVPLMTSLQIIQTLWAGAQLAHVTRWPQGRKTVHTSFVLQSTHRDIVFSRAFSMVSFSIILRNSVKNNKMILKLCNLYVFCNCWNTAEVTATCQKSLLEQIKVSLWPYMYYGEKLEYSQIHLLDLVTKMHLTHRRQSLNPGAFIRGPSVNQCAWRRTTRNREIFVEDKFCTITRPVWMYLEYTDVSNTVYRTQITHQRTR